VTSVIVRRLIGLWHGANLTFVVWGVLHGLYLVGELVLPARLRQPPQHRWEMIARMGVTFGLVSLAWIPFRANTLGEAGYIVSHLFSGLGNIWGGPPDPGVSALLEVVPWLSTIRGVRLALSVALIGVLLAADLVDARGGSLALLVRAPAWVRWGFYYAVSAAILFLGVWGLQEFIYFQF
jgi:hypothetical protein